MPTTNQPSYLGRSAVIELPLTLSEKFLEVSAGHEVLKAKILLALAAEPHDVRKTHVYEVGVGLHANRLSWTVQCARKPQHHEREQAREWEQKNREEESKNRAECSPERPNELLGGAERAAEAFFCGIRRGARITHGSKCNTMPLGSQSRMIQ